MRVISGVARGRKLKAEVPKGVRPTSDRVKESMFDMLFSLGGVMDATVIDLFCGTGALGIEALSRGARHVTFVDDAVRALKSAEETLVGVGLDLSTTARYRATLPGWKPSSPVDLVLADPPYDFTDWAALLDGFPAQMVVCESGRPLPELSGWTITKSKAYGTTLVTVLEPETSEAAS